MRPVNLGRSCCSPGLRVTVRDSQRLSRTVKFLANYAWSWSPLPIGAGTRVSDRIRCRCGADVVCCDASTRTGRIDSSRARARERRWADEPGRHCLVGRVVSVASVGRGKAWRDIRCLSLRHGGYDGGDEDGGCEAHGLAAPNGYGHDGAGGGER